MSHNAGKLKPNAFSFSVSNSWLGQSNPFDRSVSKSPITLTLSTVLSLSSTFPTVLSTVSFSNMALLTQKLLLNKVNILVNIFQDFVIK